MSPKSVEKPRPKRRAKGQSNVTRGEPVVEPESRFFNRELSALDYNARVLACAGEARRPATRALGAHSEIG